MISYKNLGRKGRLGNQLFQYAFLRLTARRLGVKFYCPEWIGDHIFQLNDEDERAKESPNISKRYVEPTYYGFNETALHIKDGTDISGYFQTEKYFENNKNEVRQWYAFRQDKISAVNEKYRRIDFSKSAGLHLRFRDMKIDSKFVIAPYRYYVKALSKVRQKENILVSSDEIETARKYLQGLKGNIIYMEDNKDYEDLYLFTQCHDFICSVSTFSWWAAWLSKYEDKIAVCPKEWIRPGCGAANDDLCCDGWVPLRTTVPVLDDYRIFRLRQRLKKGIERCINYAARR